MREIEQCRRLAWELDLASGSLRLHRGNCQCATSTFSYCPRETILLLSPFNLVSNLVHLPSLFTSATLSLPRLLPPVETIGHWHLLLSQPTSGQLLPPQWLEVVEDGRWLLNLLQWHLLLRFSSRPMISSVVGELLLPIPLLRLRFSSRHMRLLLPLRIHSVILSRLQFPLQQRQFRTDNSQPRIRLRLNNSYLLLPRLLRSMHLQPSVPTQVLSP